MCIKNMYEAMVNETMVNRYRWQLNHYTTTQFPVNPLPQEVVQ